MMYKKIQYLLFNYIKLLNNIVYNKYSTMDQQIKQESHKNNPIKMEGDDEQSEWSLSSIEQLKGLDLNEMKQQEDRQQEIKNNQDQHKNKQKSKLKPKFPPVQEVKADTKMFEVGKIIEKVGQILIIEANNCVNLADFDNWLFDDQKEMLGFVIDIFGRVDHPYYALQLLQSINEKIKQSNVIGNIVYYAQGCKTLTEEDIKSIKDKSSQQRQADNGMSSSQSQSQDSSQNIKSNFVMRKKQYVPKRKASFEHQPYHRQRTRQKKHHINRNQMYNNKYQPNTNIDPRMNYQNTNQARDRQHNQLYLENMYNVYYNQMMQLYNGQNGMPLPKPPIFPIFQQPYQQPPQPPQPPQ